jgi:acetyl-CoA synthetase
MSRSRSGPVLVRTRQAYRLDQTVHQGAERLVRGDVHIAWYEDGTLNASYNCIDRHLPRRADQTAILWEGDDPGNDRRVTYRELHDADAGSPTS